MAIKGSDARVLIDEYDFSTDTSSYAVNIALGEAECTTLQADAQQYEPLFPTMVIEQNGYVTGVDDADELEKQLYSRLGSSTSYPAVLLNTGTAACPAYVLDGTYGANMAIAAPAAGLLTINGAWGSGRGGYRGIRIASATISSTGDQTSVDLGSAGSNGGAAFLFVQAIDGTASNASFKVQSATTSGGSYTDEATFTVSAVGGYKAAMTGTVNRYVRLSCAGLGGATSITVVCICAVKGVTY